MPIELLLYHLLLTYFSNKLYFRSSWVEYLFRTLNVPSASPLIVSPFYMGPDDQAENEW